MKRLGAAFAAAALPLTLWSIPASSAATPAGRAPTDPTATSVTAPCTGGPGRATLIVSPADQDGRYPARMEARGLPDGSVWRIGFEGDGKPVRRTAADGSWSVEALVRRDEGAVIAFAWQLGRREEGFCLLVASPSKPTGGLSQCGGGLQVLVVRQLDDGTLVVRFIVAGRKPETLWNLDLRASGQDTAHRVAFQSFTNRRGVLRARVALDTPLTHPVFRMTAVSENGGRCRITVDPGMLTPGADAPAERLLRRSGDAARLAR